MHVIKTMNIIFLAFIMILIAPNVIAKERKPFASSGYVPDAETASKVAEVILVRLYGPVVEQQKPFTVKLVNERWLVVGNLPQKKGELVAGGVAHIEIDKADGRISNVFHDK